MAVKKESYAVQLQYGGGMPLYYIGPKRKTVLHCGGLEFAKTFKSEDQAQKIARYCNSLGHTVAIVKVTVTQK